MSSPMETDSQSDAEHAISSNEAELRELWESSSSAKEIQALGQVEVELVKLLQLASSAMKMLAFPEQDSPAAETNGEPQATEIQAEPPIHKLEGALTELELAAVGEERAELFVGRATLYFDTLDSIQYSLRKALYHLRRRKISPSSIMAPRPDFVPPTLGIGPSQIPSDTSRLSAGVEKQGLQEMRVEKEAWLGIVAGLERMKALQSGKNNTSDPATQPT